MQNTMIRPTQSYTYVPHKHIRFLRSRPTKLSSCSPWENLMAHIVVALGLVHLKHRILIFIPTERTN